MYSLNSLIFFLLIKKLIKSGKQQKSLFIKENLLLLTTDNNILVRAVLKLIIPITFKIKKVGYIKYQIPVLTHYYTSIKIALHWLIKATKLKNVNKMTFVKALYLECHEVLKKQGIAYNYKQQYIKKALTNRVFMYLINLKIK